MHSKPREKLCPKTEQVTRLTFLCDKAKGTLQRVAVRT